MKRSFLLFLIYFLVVSCARVGSPIGGDKDTIAPRMTGSSIDSPRVNVPVNLRELRIDFDEYIVLKDITKNLIVSPPLNRIRKILPSGIANKYILIQWSDTLQANTTYNFNFGNAIADNNEGNVLPYFNYAFSTGSKIDELYVSGTVTDMLSIKKNETNPSAKNFVVGLYKGEKPNFREKPYYVTKTDEEDYFELNYLSPGTYRILAFVDENQNSVYDAGKEKVAFLPEPLQLKESIRGLKLQLFPSQKQVKYVDMQSVAGGILMRFEGNPNKVEVRSVSPELTDYKVSHRAKSDSVNVWFKPVNSDPKSSTGLKLGYNADGVQDTVNIFYRAVTNAEMTLSNTRGNLLAPEHNFRVASNYEITRIQPDAWTLTSDSLRQDFMAKIGTNPFEIEISAKFVPGKKYELTIPSKTVSSHYTMTEKAYKFQFEADQAINYGTLNLKLLNKPASKFWVQLIDEQGNTVRSLYTDSNEVRFNALKPQIYNLRILADNNANGTWDASNFGTSTVAEDVFIFPKKIEARPLWELVETWDLRSNETKLSISRD